MYGPSRQINTARAARSITKRMILCGRSRQGPSSSRTTSTLLLSRALGASIPPARQ